MRGCLSSASPRVGEVPRRGCGSWSRRAVATDRGSRMRAAIMMRRVEESRPRRRTETAARPCGLARRISKAADEGDGRVVDELVGRRGWRECLTFPSCRSLSRTAGGEFRLGTRSMYMASHCRRNHSECLHATRSLHGYKWQKTGAAQHPKTQALQRLSTTRRPQEPQNFGLAKWTFLPPNRNPRSISLQGNLGPCARTNRSSSAKAAARTAASGSVCIGPRPSLTPGRSHRTEPCTVAPLVPDTEHFDSFVDGAVDEGERSPRDQQLPDTRHPFDRVPYVGMAAKHLTGLDVPVCRAPRTIRKDPGVVVAHPRQVGAGGRQEDKSHRSREPRNTSGSGGGVSASVPQDETQSFIAASDTNAPASASSSAALMAARFSAQLRSRTSMASPARREADRC